MSASKCPACAEAVGYSLIISFLSLLLKFLNLVFKHGFGNVDDVLNLDI
jgi:hypothetical protein